MQELKINSSKWACTHTYFGQVGTEKKKRWVEVVVSVLTRASRVMIHVRQEENSVQKDSGTHAGLNFQSLPRAIYGRHI